MAGNWGIFAGLLSVIIWALSMIIIGQVAELFNVAVPQYVGSILLLASITLGFYLGIKMTTPKHKQSKPWIFDDQFFEE